jgi:hypothetical protein
MVLVPYLSLRKKIGKRQKNSYSAEHVSSLRHDGDGYDGLDGLDPKETEFDLE